MEIRKAIAQDMAVFEEWKVCGRIEERTCRPVEGGRRVPSSSEIFNLSFVVEGFEEPVGKFTYFDHNPRNRSCEFGYMINPKYRGQGLGGKMIAACIDYLFRDTELDLNKLYCQTAEFNTPSVRILDKLGLNRDGILREHHELDGKLWSDFVYSVLRAEWENK